MGAMFADKVVEFGIPRAIIQENLDLTRTK